MRNSGRSGCSEAAWWTVFLATLTAIVLLLTVGGGGNNNPFPQIFKRTLDGRTPGSPLLEAALFTTVFCVLGALFTSIMVGGVVAMLQLSRRFVARFLGALYVETFRGLPIYVMLLFVYFGVRTVLKGVPLPFDIPGITADESPYTISLSPFVAAILALGCCYGAYMAEVIRAGMRAIPVEEIEAASLEASRWQVYRHVIFPQAFRIILPALINECIGLTKDSSLIGAVTLVDITRSAHIYAGSTFLFFETFASLALMYLLLSLVLSRLQRTLEAQFSRQTIVVSRSGDLTDARADSVPSG